MARDDVNNDRTDTGADAPSRRLSKAERRQQLLDTALRIVREEGADRLTLGHLAIRAGVSKPVTYEHFGTRSGLLIELYRAMDEQQVSVLRQVLATGERDAAQTAGVLATTYLQCASDTNGEWHAVGAALAGSAEKDAVLRDLLDGYVQLFANALAPHSRVSATALACRCEGIIGAGEALSAAMVRGRCSEADAVDALVALIRGALV
ncbi:MAG: HTH-type transcriptional regulator BetI [Luteibacter sp.]|uniref:TetR/AcrR family transcriptional regulator n=1 Tax=Luteibacter sp. TaxID=1886636 RepID=UPI0013863693|nr:TetR/AcrR family transcriptional regulator [Luteibacter sp.]KAF1006188.1 MAG: HTH-type transcriptional regulator BetI [Luteibacter sp.]